MDGVRGSATVAMVSSVDVDGGGEEEVRLRTWSFVVRTAG